MADVQHAHAANFQKIAQHGRAAAFQHFRRGAVQLDRIVRHQAVPARNQLQGQFAFAQARCAREQHAHFKHIQKHAVLDGGYGQHALQVNPQHVHQIRAFQRGGEQRHIVRVAIIA